MEAYIEDSDMEMEMEMLRLPFSQIGTFEGPDLVLEDEDRILNSEDDQTTSPAPSPPPLPSPEPSTTTVKSQHHINPHVVILTHKNSKPSTSTSTAHPSTDIITPTTTDSNTSSTIPQPTPSTATLPSSGITTPITSNPNTSSNTIPQPTVTTTSAFEELVALNKRQSRHLHHINILQKHTLNHTTPVALNITVQPHVQLSPQHQATWDTAIGDCTRSFLSTLISHHQEQIQKIQKQIHLVSTTLQSHSSHEVSTTLINVASSSHTGTPKSSKRPHPNKSTPPNHKRHKPPTNTSKPHHKPTATTTKSHQPDFRKRPRCPKPRHTPPPTSPLVPPRHHQAPRTSPHHPTSSTHPNPMLHLMGNKNKFPIIYNMFMKGK